MFDNYNYLKERLPQLSGIKAIYRVRDRFKLDELIANIREVEFPCIAVEVNAGGRLSLRSGLFDRSTHAFHVLDRIEDREYNADEIQHITQACKISGRNILKMMQSESKNINAPCYGLDVDNILYNPIGPIGLGCYGCTYNFAINDDNVSE